MKKTHAPAKLALRKLTLRRMSPRALATVQGGANDFIETSTGSAYVCCARPDKR